MKSKKDSPINWFFVVFGCALFIAGLVVGYFSFGSTTLKYFSSSDWQQVQANISSIVLKKRDGEKTRNSIKATYSYSYDGDRQSNSVGFYTADSYKYWEDLYNKLVEDQEKGNAQAWVNPNNPNEALLDRTIRWGYVVSGSIALLLLCGFGIAFIWLGIKQEEYLEKDKLKAITNGINSQEKTGSYGIFLFSLPFIIGSLAIFFFSLPDPNHYKGEYLFVIILASILACIGCGVVGFAYIKRRRYKLIGPTPLFLDPSAGVIGGQVGGQFDIESWPSSAPIKVMLTCNRQTRVNKQTIVEMLWQDEMQGYVEQHDQGVRVSFVFNCPDDLPSSISQSGSIYWEVRANTDVEPQQEAIKFERSWVIPVEHGEPVASSINIPESFIQQQKQDKREVARSDAKSLLKFSQQGRFLNIENTNKLPLKLPLLGLFFGSITFAAGTFESTNAWWQSFLFVLLGAILIGISLFMLGRGIDVKVDTDSRILYVKRKWFFIILYKREIRLYAPSQFSTQKTISTASGKKLISWYKIEVNNQGEKVLIAEAIGGEDVAQAFMNGIINKVLPHRF